MSDQKPKIATADICDAMGNAVEIISTPFHNYGGRPYFSGPAVTVRTDNDNSEVKNLLTTPGHGRVLVVDNRGRMNCAMVGGNLAKWGAENGWAAIIVHGCVRDLHEMIEQPIAIKALATYPKRSDKGSAESHLGNITLAGVTIRDGMWLTGDLDGLVVTTEKPVGL